MLIDTHAHLNFKDFNADYQAVIDRALSADCDAIINVGSNLLTSQKAVKIAQDNKNVFAAVGLHPIHVKDETFNEAEFLKLAKNKKVVAIGETGLDYYYDRSNAETQKEVFSRHIKLANAASKPIIIHARESYDDVLSILTSQHPLNGGVMHCFLGKADFAKIIIAMGFYLSFTGIITFTKNDETVKVIQETPLEKILVETDCPYLTPEPHRGQRNEPAYVVEVAKKIAAIKKISFEQVAEVTTQNAVKLFKLNISN